MYFTTNLTGLITMCNLMTLRWAINVILPFPKRITILQHLVQNTGRKHHLLPRLVFSKVFIGDSGQNTVAPQPGTENSLNQFPNSLYVREHPPLPSEVQKETLQ